jgi:hypothetical protein
MKVGDECDYRWDDDERNTTQVSPFAVCDDDLQYVYDETQYGYELEEFWSTMTTDSHTEVYPPYDYTDGVVEASTVDDMNL